VKNQEPPASILAFLAEVGATHTPHHAGRSLSTHLVATWKILNNWQQPEAICIGGLCHSLYGTDAFDTACLGPLDRPKVQAAIGIEAEQISFLFGAMHREAFLQQPDLCEIENRFTDTKISIDHNERSAICHILLANELDLVIAKKGSGRPDKVSKKVSPIYEILEPFLSTIAKTDYRTLSQSK
jgi:hypothetical protein